MGYGFVFYTDRRVSEFGEMLYRKSVGEYGFTSAGRRTVKNGCRVFWIDTYIFEGNKQQRVTAHIA